MSRYRGRDFRTLTMDDLFEDWNDFKEQSGIDDNEDYKNTFELIFALENDTWLKNSSSDYAINDIRFAIEVETKKFKKISSVYDLDYKMLLGEYKETNVFKMGDITIDPDNFDKFKTARQTENKTIDLLDKLDKLGIESPIETMIQNLRKKLFILL